MSNVYKNASNEDAKKVFVDIANLLQQGKGQEGLTLLQANRDILFAFDPEKTLRANFELRFLLNQYDEAYEDYDYFSSLPYVSQQVEEILRGLPKLIRANELASKGKDAFDEEIAHAVLSDGEDPYAVLGVLQQLKNRDITPFLEEIKSVLTSGIHDDAKTFALMLLVDKKVDEEVLLLKGERAFRVNPNKLGNPFASASYVKMRGVFSTLKDSSLSNVCAQLLDQVVLSSYPEKAFQDERFDAYKSAFLHIGVKYLGQEDPSALSEEAQKAVERIEKLLQTPSLLR